MPITLPPLPYEKDALKPHISKTTLKTHYGKHHQGYVNKLNKAIAGTPYENASLEEIIRDTAGDETKSGIFNNAAQVWNHSFYWSSMKPGGGGKPTGEIANAVNKCFGTYEDFRDEFETAGKTQFGSGWAWLVAKDGKLEVRKTSNAETPLTDTNCTPLLTMDVWEHAYYLDYHNSRRSYVQTFVDELLNWDFANANLAKV